VERLVHGLDEQVGLRAAVPEEQRLGHPRPTGDLE
jgi:hypothetical protein